MFKNKLLLLLSIFCINYASATLYLANFSDKEIKIEIKTNIEQWGSDVKILGPKKDDDQYISLVYKNNNVIIWPLANGTKILLKFENYNLPGLNIVIKIKGDGSFTYDIVNLDNYQKRLDYEVNVENLTNNQKILVTKFKLIEDQKEQLKKEEQKKEILKCFLCQKTKDVKDCGACDKRVYCKKHFENHECTELD